MTAVTAITAQNTVAVTAVHAIPPEIIRAQVLAVAQDIGVDAVKIGMLGTVATIAAVAEALEALAEGTPVVLDPVMVSESGAELLEPEARVALIERLLPLATVVTPNLPEARQLAGTRAPQLSGTRASQLSGTRASQPTRAQEDEAERLARAIRALGPDIVVVTGGHRDQATDVFFDGQQLHEISGPRHPDGAAHGSGCTHSSVLAARLAWGDSPLQAARTAKQRAAEAVRNGLIDVGAGPGPVDALGVT
jgi:hydroxymethylpyrimidine/phosphomethylpyrimidine kinase